LISHSIAYNKNRIKVIENFPFELRNLPMPAPQIALDLIERFDRNVDAYKSGAYNETRVRREFIDPFFGALGWDVIFLLRAILN